MRFISHACTIKRHAKKNADQTIYGFIVRQDHVACLSGHCFSCSSSCEVFDLKHYFRSSSFEGLTLKVAV